MNDLTLTSACLTLGSVAPVRTRSVGSDLFPHRLLHSILAALLLRVFAASILRMILLLRHASGSIRPRCSVCNVRSFIHK